MKAELKIEKSTPADNNIKSVYSSIYPTLCCNGYKFNADQKERLIAHFSHYLPSLKIGAGGSHLWISDRNNERLAIIYFK